MHDPKEELEHDDREVFVQVFAAAYPKLTAMQQHCLLLSVTGFTQAQIGEMLGVGQQAVSRHFTKAIGQVAATAEELRN